MKKIIQIAFAISCFAEAIVVAAEKWYAKYPPQPDQEEPELTEEQLAFNKLNNEQNEQ